MVKNQFFVARALAIVLIFGMLFFGCSTTQHSVEISNVSNLREVYIRSTGTYNWGKNMAGSLHDIDKSIFSASVDIRVIDANGIAYSKYNVPFDDDTFVETSKERYMGIGTDLLTILAGAAILIPVIILGGDK
jgi:hypothetical protein